MLDELYSDIGEKMKSWAKGIFVVETISSIIMALILFFVDPDLFFVSLLILFLGPLFAWISTWFLYGFGEIIDKLCCIERNTTGHGQNVPLSNPGYSQYATPVSNHIPPQAVTPNGWTCSCGRNHAPYESSCICGKTRQENR